MLKLNAPIKTLAISVLIFLGISFTIAQKPLSKNAQEMIRWQQRVDDLTDGVVQDSKSLEDCEKALYLALLAKMWWKTEPDEARKYLKKAADLMLSDFESGDKKGRPKKLKYGQKTLQIITGLDEKLGQTTGGELEELVMDGREDGTIQDPDMADMGAKIGLQFVETNPSMALAYGFDSLHYGRSSHLLRLFSELYAKDKELGEVLLRRALQVAKGVFSDENSSFVAGLGNYIFDTRPGRVVSDPLRRLYLEVYAEFVAGAAEIESERSKRCTIAFFAPTILSKFDEYLPGLSQTVMQNVQICIAYLPEGSQQYTKDRISGEEPKTPEDCISAARAAKEPVMKVRYFMAAITKFAEAKKYDDIISLLDGMNEDERKIFGEERWDDLRGMNTFALCRAYFKSKDMAAFYRVIDRTPRRPRTYVRFRLREEISPVKDRELYLENAEAISKELKSLEFKPIYAASNYLLLADMYLKVQPTEAERPFRDAVKAINVVDGENPDYEAIKDYYSGMDVIPLAAELLEIDEFSITSSLRNISSRRSRVRLKLGLLESSMQKLAEVKKKVEAENKKPAKEKATVNE